MMYNIQRSAHQIERLKEFCRACITSGESERPHLTYEEGVVDAIEWITNYAREPLFAGLPEQEPVTP